MVEYDQRHGGPWDRGSADAYYGREYDQTDKVTLGKMSAEELVAYTAVYRSTHERKDWG